MDKISFSIVLIPEGNSYSSWCPELDVASQGHSVEEAMANLKEAVELHIECLSPNELQVIRSKHGKRLVSMMEITMPA